MRDADQAATIARLEACVAELEAALAEARHAAAHDALTGLLNRAGFADAWAREARPGRLLALFDLDGFKQVNDRYGHAAGDMVLSAVADQIRGLPAAARLGGDEFVALVDPGDLLPVRVAAVLPDGSTVSVAASIGLAPAGGHLSGALGRADAAMYRAKAGGQLAEVYDPHRNDRPVEARPRLRLRDELVITAADVLRARPPRQRRAGG